MTTLLRIGLCLLIGEGLGLCQDKLTVSSSNISATDAVLGIPLPVLGNFLAEIRQYSIVDSGVTRALYETETKALNLAVKRNLKRFPRDFMFQLTKEEFESLRFQIETSKNGDTTRLQIETSKGGRGGTRYLPYAFTEQGVAMLSGILNSDKAIAMNIAIMRAFVEIRRILIRETDLRTQLKEIRERLGEHDTQLNAIYDAMENLLDEKAAQKKFEERRRVGFKITG